MTKPYEPPRVIDLAEIARCPEQCAIGNTFEPPSCTYGHHDHSAIEEVPAEP